ncbi:MAG: hypothetical protein AAGD96_30840, partial [Chloroflexota bacterium]
MVNAIFKQITVVGLVVTFFAASSTAFGQDNNFSIDISDGRIDAAWDTVPAFVFGAVDYDESGEEGLSGDIISAWFVFDKADPSKLFFRVDGYDVIDKVSLKIDCDEDQQFNSDSDREIYFYSFDDIEENGEIEGEVDFSTDFLDQGNSDEYLDSSLFAEGEYVLLDQDPSLLHVSFEAVIDLSQDD